MQEAQKRPAPRFKIVDVGAMWVGEVGEPFHTLTQAFPCEVIGFEPQADQCQILRDLDRPGRTYLPYFIGDGTRQTFHECNMPYTSSLLEPNTALLERFHNIADLTQVVQTHAVDTVRLDDIPETEGVDFLKVDVQGGELMVFEGARQRLQHALVVQTEIEFLPMYKNQPLFGDIDVFLRGCGFAFHRFAHVEGRTLKPMMINNDPNLALSQMMWGDAIYVRNLETFDDMQPEALYKLAMILHHVYGSFDLAAVALASYDAKQDTHFMHEYLQARRAGG